MTEEKFLMSSTKKKKIQKGEYGYFRAEKKRRFWTTLILFAVPLFIFASAWIYFGTRNTVWTVVGTVGCLPACKMLVSLIMILRCKPVDEEVYKKIREHQGSLTMGYEMYMTFYEKSAGIDAVAVCGNTVAGYSSDPRIDAAFMENEAQKIIRKNGYKATVKIFTDLKPFLERLDSMNEHREALEADIKFTSDAQYPELSRNELIRRTILAICL